jgi:hypothetical protein
MSALLMMATTILKNLLLLLSHLLLKLEDLELEILILFGVGKNFDFWHGLDSLIEVQNALNLRRIHPTTLLLHL